MTHHELVEKMLTVPDLSPLEIDLFTRYMRVRDELAESEGKVYALTETLDGMMSRV